MALPHRFALISSIIKWNQFNIQKRPMKSIKPTLLLLFGMAFCGVHAQNMYVMPNAGTQSVYSVANIQKITFSGGNMLVTNTTGGNGTFALADNRYVKFADFPLEVAANERANNRFFVYPNPVGTILNLANYNGTQTISQLAIYSMDGRLLLTQNAFTGNNPQVEVSHLPAGSYLCKIMAGNQTQTIQFLKQ
ncbi:MAG: hypothetical protein CFE24_05420 [Flavobacterium sp. BFFFF2]|nr:MAG: hypothetical protein CFE24_05420 [Flavobacterium sp. BFFFF2]